ncbi:MAG TPA: hypothetical protein VIH99_10490 [Bdellovibrionota bacterium]|jgi:hypothetical protein
MKRTSALVAVSILLVSLFALVLYFVSVPDLRKTETNAKLLYEHATQGGSLAEVIGASPHFARVDFGGCGSLAPSTDSGPKGSLIFSPAVGAFARYATFDEFLRLNPKLLASHDECRRISVLYMAIFPYRGVVDLEVDGKGRILFIADPRFFY